MQVCLKEYCVLCLTNSVVAGRQNPGGRVVELVGGLVGGVVALVVVEFVVKAVMVEGVGVALTTVQCFHT